MLFISLASACKDKGTDKNKPDNSQQGNNGSEDIGNVDDGTANDKGNGSIDSESGNKNETDKNEEAEEEEEDVNLAKLASPTNLEADFFRLTWSAVL